VVGHPVGLPSYARAAYAALESIELWVMTSRRLALVIGSQCAALGRLSFLPADAGPVEVGRLPGPQRLPQRRTPE